MPSSEFEEWKEFSQLEPFGSAWENRLAMLPIVMWLRIKTAKRGERIDFSEYMHRDPESKAEQELQKKINKQNAFFDALAKKAKPAPPTHTKNTETPES